MTMTEETAAVSLRVDLDAVAKYWGILLGLGVLTVLAGAAAIILPLAAAIAVELLLGILLVLDGILQGIHAWHVRGRNGFAWKLAAALLSLAAGVLLLAFPLAGVLTLTLVVAVFFLMAGVFKSVLAFQWRPTAGWGWLLFSGLLSLLLGFAILVAFPQAAARVVGLLVGIALLFDGVWLIGTAFAARALRSGAGAESAEAG